MFASVPRVAVRLAVLFSLGALTAWAGPDAGVAAPSGAATEEAIRLPVDHELVLSVGEAAEFVTDAPDKVEARLPGHQRLVLRGLAPGATRVQVKGPGIATKTYQVTVTAPPPLETANELVKLLKVPGVTAALVDGKVHFQGKLTEEQAGRLRRLIELAHDCEGEKRPGYFCSQVVMPR